MNQRKFLDADVLDTPIYVASRASVPMRPGMWRMLRDKEGWNITSTWIDEAGPEETKDFAELWDRIHKEITVSKGLILYARTEDFPLKGALVEVGMALGMKLPVAIVLDGVKIEYPHVRPVGSWIKHPLVSLHPYLNVAYERIAVYRKGMR